MLVLEVERGLLVAGLLGLLVAGLWHWLRLRFRLDAEELRLDEFILDAGLGLRLVAGLGLETVLWLDAALGLVGAGLSLGAGLVLDAGLWLDADLRLVGAGLVLDAGLWLGSGLEQGSGWG